MKRPRLHRSLILWAGIFLMAFLGWGWWQSWHKVANLWIGDWRYSCANGGALVGWSSGHGGEVFSMCEDQDYPKMGYTTRDLLWPQGYRGKNMDPGIFLRSKFSEAPELSLAARIEIFIVNQATDAWIFYLPFPFLLLLTFVLWLIALAWRALHIRKLGRSQAIET